VGRFIGRLGVVPMPAIEHGLGLVDRVVRRHVAKLEKVGWCERIPTIRGDGMLVWLTPSGLDGVGLRELPALRTPQRFSPQTTQSIRVAWAAADIQRAGHQWISRREMTLAPSQWGVQVANERGGVSRRLPDLVFWPAGDVELRVAVVVIQGLPKPRREGAALEGWRASIVAGEYVQVRYLAGRASSSHLRRVAVDIGLTAAQFSAGDRVMADEAPVLPVVIATVEEVSVAVETAPVAASDPPRPSPEYGAPPRPTTDEAAETAERAAEHQKLLDEVLGRGQPARRRRWRRGAV
jgi:hypothetical protein